MFDNVATCIKKKLKRNENLLAIIVNIAIMNIYLLRGTQKGAYK